MLPVRPIIRTTQTRTKAKGVLVVVPAAGCGALRRMNQALVLLLVVAAFVSMMGSARLLHQTLPTMDTAIKTDVKINLPRTTYPPRSRVASTVSTAAIVSTTATHFSKLGGTPGSSPPPSLPYSSRSSSRMFSQTLLAAYNLTVTNAVNVHASIWNYMTPYHHLAEDALDGRCAAIQTAHHRSNIPKYQRLQRPTQHQHNPDTASARKNKIPDHPSEEKKEEARRRRVTEHISPQLSTLPAGFLFDTVTNITGSFAQLATACAQQFPAAKTTEPKTNATFDALVMTFEHDCLEFMHSLAYAPRCTTRMDSRYDCAKLAARAAASNTVMTEDVTTFMTKTAQEVIDKLFVEENPNNATPTLNIVIQGTGPCSNKQGNGSTHG